MVSGGSHPRAPFARRRGARGLSASPRTGAPAILTGKRTAVRGEGRGTPGNSLRPDRVDHVAVYVRQSALNAVVVEGQPRVVEAQQVQDRGVKVVHRDRLVGDLIAHLVGSPVADAL